MKEDSIFFGVDYYPEHWPRDRWETDARLMKEAGFDAVRMGEFSWAKMEPSLGNFCFDWLDDAIAVLAGHGFKVVLGTPTAVPPVWVIEDDPEILPVNKLGIKMGFGGRHHVCMSNVHYREHITRVVTAMAEHYRDNDAVIGWQIDNELGNSHEELCLCGNCQAKFQEWLERKYGTIEKLNETYGTVFWSQTYSGFHQLPAPRLTPNSHNPSLLLDWKRFCSDLIIEYQQLQIDIIRGIDADRFVTHNLMGFFDKIDYFRLAKNLDFICHDQYPSGFWLEDHAVTPSSELAAVLDLMRGLKDRPFWIMEQQSGPTGWETLARTPRPGQLRLWTAQAVAHGADAIFYFRWRSCLFGTEQYWHGILPHSGVPGRRYEEIKQAISELRPVMQKTKGLKARPDVAILFSYEQNWAFEIQPHHPDLDYIRQSVKYYKYFYDRNIPVDFVSAESDFSKYSLVVAPLQFLSDDAVIKKLEAYVSNGGNLSMTMRTGVKDENNVCLSGFQLPGRFGELLGIEILDYDCLRGQGVEVCIESKAAGTAQKWGDIITPRGARAVALYNGEYYAGLPAVTANTYGGGLAWYIGFEPDEQLMGRVMDMVCAKADILPPAEGSEGLELVRRPAADGYYYFALNHGAGEARVMKAPGWETVLGADVIEPYGIAVFFQKI